MDSEVPKDRTSYAVEDTLARPFVAVRTWYRSLVPERVPEGVRAVFTLGLVLFVSAVAALVSGDAELTTAEIAAVVIAGIGGLLLAWGVANEHPYPRVLAPAVVAAVTLLTGISMRPEPHLVIIDGAAIGLAWYLFFNDEARAYYRSLHTS